MKEYQLKELIYLIIAIIIAVIAINILIWLLPIILIVILAYFIYSKMKHNRFKSTMYDQKEKPKNNHKKTIIIDSEDNN